MQLGNLVVNATASDIRLEDAKKLLSSFVTKQMILIGDAPESAQSRDIINVISMRTHPGNWVERPVSYNTTPLLLRTRLQLPSGRRHERAPPRAATTPPKWCSTPLSAPKGVILTRTRPCNWVG